MVTQCRGHHRVTVRLQIRIAFVCLSDNAFTSNNSDVVVVVAGTIVLSVGGSVVVVGTSAAVGIIDVVGIVFCFVFSLAVILITDNRKV